MPGGPCHPPRPSQGGPRPRRLARSSELRCCIYFKMLEGLFSSNRPHSGQVCSSTAFTERDSGATMSAFGRQFQLCIEEASGYAPKDLTGGGPGARPAGIGPAGPARDPAASASAAAPAAHRPAGAPPRDKPPPPNSMLPQLCQVYPRAFYTVAYPSLAYLAEHLCERGHSSWRWSA